MPPILGRGKIKILTFQATCFHCSFLKHLETLEIITRACAQEALLTLCSLEVAEVSEQLLTADAKIER